MITSITKFETGSRDAAKKVISSLRPDMGFDDEMERSSASLEVKGRHVVLKVESKDLAAFRATLNTYTRLIEVSKELIENGEGNT